MSVVLGSLCTGYGGLDAGVLAALGRGRVAWVADPDPHVSALLSARLPGVPNLGDTGEVDWSVVEPVDVLGAGFPCQDVSSAGGRAGIKQGTRSGLFFEVVRAIEALRAPLVVIENVAALRWRGGGMGIVLGELARVGYDCVWTSLRASEVGAAHRRERVFLLGWPREALPAVAATVAVRGLRAVPDLAMPVAAPVPAPAGPAGQAAVSWGEYEPAIRRWEAVLGRPAPCPVEPGRSGRPRLSARFVEWLMGLPDGMLTGLDLPRTAQLRILGNGVVPQQAAHAVALLLRQYAALAADDVRSEQVEAGAA